MVQRNAAEHITYTRLLTGRKRAGGLCESQTRLVDGSVMKRMAYNRKCRGNQSTQAEELTSSGDKNRDGRTSEQKTQPLLPPA
ncbi:hypothetical protein F2P81_004100 [Scophthalmus maximus]|uniref:Uncharacterized protein n=1 Tax=Scophthalmus maximus TaxID=52904 RepID=A0A6A4T9K9_SCOMX|nr:hypothetical protein F2P81_026427 [Scophthalmus maximus]KAF0042763.1 hypothetical protein F2P81_004100 [Scophthalmus maximus]